MRQSTLPPRSSYISASISQANSSAALAKLLEKKKEYHAVSALERASSLYLERIEGLGDDFDIMANAGQSSIQTFIELSTPTLTEIVHGQVLEQWPNMFRLLNLFLSSTTSQQEPTANDPSDVHASPVEGERLVRIPIEELQ